MLSHPLYNKAHTKLVLRVAYQATRVETLVSRRRLPIHPLPPLAAARGSCRAKPARRMAAAGFLEASSSLIQVVGSSGGGHSFQRCGGKEAWRVRIAAATAAWHPVEGCGPAAAMAPFVGLAPAIRDG